MNKLNPVVLTSTCLLSIAVACTHKAQNEPQSPPPAMMPAAGSQPGMNSGPMPGATPQGAKVTPLEPIGQPVDGGNSTMDSGSTNMDGGSPHLR